MKESSQSNEVFTLVYASQPQRDESLRKQAALDVFNAVKDMDIELQLKCHPRETNPLYYHNLAKKSGCTNYRILPANADLYETLANCNALITCFSTVGLEAVYFDKPMLVLDHLKQDLQGYVSSGVGQQVVSAEEIKEALQLIINGQKGQSEAREQYIAEHAMAIDGSAWDRVLGVLLNNDK